MWSSAIQQSSNPLKYVATLKLVYFIECSNFSGSASGCDGAGLEPYIKYLTENRGGSIPPETKDPYKEVQSAVCLPESDNLNTGVKVSKGNLPLQLFLSLKLDLLKYRLANWLK